MQSEILSDLSVQQITHARTEWQKQQENETKKFTEKIEFPCENEMCSVELNSFSSFSLSPSED